MAGRRTEPKSVDALKRLERRVRILAEGIEEQEERLTFAERAERFATDAPFQWLRQMFFLFRTRVWTTSSLTESDAEASAQAAYGESHVAWVFGRKMSPAALGTYNFLRNRGVSRRDLRLAVFCGTIRPDGSVKLNQARERALQLCGLLIIAISASGVAVLAYRVVSLDVSVAWKVLTPLLVLGFLATLQYPWLVLTLRAPYVALKLDRIWKIQTKRSRSDIR